jgi:hypothetical protein
LRLLQERGFLVSHRFFHSPINSPPTLLIGHIARTKIAVCKATEPKLEKRKSPGSVIAFKLLSSVRATSIY